MKALQKKRTAKTQTHKTNQTNKETNKQKP